MSWSKLKDEGNSLFSRGDYEAAQAKYTRAIDTTTGDDDPEAVAVLYGNRAACLLYLKRSVSPTRPYGSGTSDWEQALHELTPSVASWEKAVAAMKVKNPSSMSLNEVKQLQEYENGLRTARTALALQGSSSIPGYHMTPSKGQLPWERAESMKAELMARGPAGYSSSEFKTGVETMKALKKIQTPAGVAYAGATGKGWNDVRPALATTIRGWIMRGFIEGHVRMNNSSAPEFLGRALEVLEWGRSEWAGIPDDQRGAIFQDTFVRGVRCLRLERLLINMTQGSSRSSLFTLAARHCRKWSSPFQGADSRTCRMKGFYHKQMVLSSTARSKEEVHDHFRNAAKYHLAAAETYPEDDEQHACRSLVHRILMTMTLYIGYHVYVGFLYCALENLFQAGTPLRVTLPIMKRITASMDKMKRIWEHSAMAMGGRDTALQKAIWMEEDVMKALSEGAYTMEDKVMPEPDAWPYGTPWPTN
ncbi:hypothetical protein GLOTRDRAFT_49327 [Gloeophyllum trabeum ATCC 11539]|uniref:TPR-like protein n=1 Tax=Gloeophyllum trabeum (strain ATCC 11539 / FP-39264 / Madison 617) TaxID=670483 RepID=S7PUX4_GLOTA|nr:uncharacterized protein GLOTRDRAFT_49327 [Gloeophyllum trabeum ATCC 11539]EPQ51112.1 hypothetical protein GLOTRDRAFT_49327 [Gloeophyllum trabeum ATCC 11539]